jgi:UDP-N-acetyl-D-mannosaminuronic acid dehydrogenase
MNPVFSTISVIGLGYIGLPTAAMFASHKLKVVGVDVNATTVATINSGKVHIVEPDLDIVVKEAVQQGYLSATMETVAADAFLIAVPTPFREGDYEPDLRFIEAASKAVAEVLKPGDLVVLESTSPVGTTEQMAAWLAAARPDLSFPQSHGEASDIRIAHCPERVLPGRVMQELITNDRVIGGMTPECSARAAKLYNVFVTGECVQASSPRVAEMSKLIENSFRDVNIAFANEASLLCDELGIDVWELIALANRHPRVNILQPGPGVGGHCIAVDPWFIVSSAPATARLIRTAREVNDRKPDWVIEKVQAAIGAALMAVDGKSASDLSLAIYGLAFKPDIDDLRESPAIKIAQHLSEQHPGPMMIVEPHIERLPYELSKAELVSFDTARSAEVHLMLVDHTVFRGTSRPDGMVVDTRGVWNVD